MIYEWVTSLNSDTLECGVADHQELSMCVRTQMDHWHSPMRLGDKKSCSKSIFTIMQFSSSLSHWHHWNIHECLQLHHLVELLNLSTTLPLHQLRESLKLKWNYIPIGGQELPLQQIGTRHRFRPPLQTWLPPTVPARLVPASCVRHL